MPIYEYQGILKSGKKTKGTFDADSEKIARARLKQMGIYTTSIKENSQGKKGLSGDIKLSFSKRIPLARLAQETRQLATLVSAGIPLVEALQALADQCNHAAFKRIIVEARERVEDGSSMAKAISHYPEAFPRLYINMVAAGEASGTLDNVLENLADYFEAQLELRRKIQSSLFYPVMMLFICVAVVFALVAFVVPTIVQIFEKEGAILPLPTRILIATSDTVTKGWPILLILIFGSIFGTIAFYRTPHGRSKIDRLLLKLPLVGPLFEKTYTARISSTLGTLLSSGVELLQALDIVKNLLGNVHYVQALKDARDGVKEGKQLSRELAKTNLFPTLFCQMVGVGERSGRLENMLDRAGKSFKNEVSSAITGLTSLMEPLMILGLGVLVLFIAVSVLMPMFDLMDKIQG